MMSDSCAPADSVALQPRTANTTDMLASLPDEILLQLLTHFDERELINLQLVSRALRTLVCSSDVWRPRIKALWDEHAVQQSSAASTTQLFDADQDWFSVWQYIGKYAKILGACSVHR